MIRKIPLWLLASTLLVFLLFYSFTSGGDVPTPPPKVRTLKSYHAEFRLEDGSAYSDAALAEILMAKGIPFLPDPIPLPPKTPGTFELLFITREFSLEQQKEINGKFNEILTNHFTLTKFPVHSLQKGFVTGELKLQLFFTEEFKKVAEDESQLTDFNESLNAMGLLGLKGVEIFIEDRPLGEYLKELDAKRDAEAAMGRRLSGNVR